MEYSSHTRPEWFLNHFFDKKMCLYRQIQYISSCLPFFKMFFLKWCLMRLFFISWFCLYHMYYSPPLLLKEFWVGWRGHDPDSRGSPPVLLPPLVSQVLWIYFLIVVSIYPDAILSASCFTLVPCPFCFHFAFHDICRSIWCPESPPYSTSLLDHLFYFAEP